MAEIAYTVETAIQRFTEPNWCWADYCCDCDACRAGGVLAQEVARLRSDLTACQLDRDEARRKLDYRNREAPHCPSCDCGSQLPQSARHPESSTYQKVVP